MRLLYHQGFLHALGVAAYVSAVAWFMEHAPGIVGEPPKWLGGVVFLLLFIVSAAITGLLVFGRPVLWYLDGKRREAVRLALMTVLWLAVFVMMGVLMLAIR